MNRLIPIALLAITNTAFAVGVVNPEVTQDNLKETVCKRGWSTEQRPPVAWTSKIKHRLLKRGDLAVNYELDHIVPISIGGAPADTKNLWLQPWDGHCGAKEKDIVERQTWHDLCAGKTTLKKAQEVFLNWECK